LYIRTVGVKLHLQYFIDPLKMRYGQQRPKTSRTEPIFLKI
jgi:hypothetical protein